MTREEFEEFNGGGVTSRTLGLSAIGYWLSAISA
jgi:hypothetical protein